MTDLHSSRRQKISIGTSVRRRITETVAANRTSANFTPYLSEGPYSGVTVLKFADERHQDNSDAENNPNGIGNFSKGLSHDPTTGLADDYASFADGLDDARQAAAQHDDVLGDAGIVATIEAALDDNSTRPADRQRERSFVNPLAGLATAPVGLDPYDITIPPAPEMSSKFAAVEMVELYWMALLRDIPFANWDGHPDADAAITELDDLNAMLDAEGTPFAEHYRPNLTLGTGIGIQRLFRGSAPGATIGGYISRFMLDDVRFGTQTFDQMQQSPVENVDYMLTWDAWHDVQEGRQNREMVGNFAGAEPSPAEMEAGGPVRHISTLRDLAHYVHFDQLHQAYFNAALIMLNEGVPLNRANMYTHAPHNNVHAGFGSFGGPMALTLLTEVATRALKAVWHQKWYVHRRLRPEVMGARLDAMMRNVLPAGTVHDVLANSVAVARTRAASADGNYLLPMAFPEGSPMHPSYGAGHGTVAGACVTILKALFDTDATIASWGDPDLTVGGELNKLAANIAIGRNGAGVHYRSDYTKSLALGEAIALATMQEYASCYVEAKDDMPIWCYQNFSGKFITIEKDGTIGISPTGHPVQAPAALVAQAPDPAPQGAPATVGQKETEPA